MPRGLEPPHWFTFPGCVESCRAATLPLHQDKVCSLSYPNQHRSLGSTVQGTSVPSHQRGTDPVSSLPWAYEHPAPWRQAPLQWRAKGGSICSPDASLWICFLGKKLPTCSLCFPLIFQEEQQDLLAALSPHWTKPFWLLWSSLRR